MSPKMDAARPSETLVNRINNISRKQKSVGVEGSAFEFGMFWAVGVNECRIMLDSIHLTRRNPMKYQNELANQSSFHARQAP